MSCVSGEISCFFGVFYLAKVGDKHFVFLFWYNIIEWTLKCCPMGWGIFSYLSPKCCPTRWGIGQFGTQFNSWGSGYGGGGGSGFTLAGALYLIFILYYTLAVLIILTITVITKT